MTPGILEVDEKHPDRLHGHEGERVDAGSSLNAQLSNQRALALAFPAGQDQPFATFEHSVDHVVALRLRLIEELANVERRSRLTGLSAYG